MALKVIDDSHKYTTVKGGDMGPGGANHEYHILIKPLEGDEGGPYPLKVLKFQKGPIKEAGVNGVMDENLIAICIDRLRGFQSGPYACEYNAKALAHLEAALDFLTQRTKDRENQGIEGTHTVGAESKGSAQLMASPWAWYKKTALQEMRPYVPGEDLSGVSVNAQDTPEAGGMIGRNTKDPLDQWYVAELFFHDNYEPAVK